MNCEGGEPEFALPCWGVGAYYTLPLRGGEPNFPLPCGGWGADFALPCPMRGDSKNFASQALQAPGCVRSSQAFPGCDVYPAKLSQAPMTQAVLWVWVQPRFSKFLLACPACQVYVSLNNVGSCFFVDPFRKPPVGSQAGANGEYMGNMLLPYQVVSNMVDISKVVHIFGNFSIFLHFMYLKFKIWNSKFIFSFLF